MRQTIIDIITALSGLQGIEYSGDDWGQMNIDPEGVAFAPIRMPAALVAPLSGQAETTTKESVRELHRIGVRLVDAPGTAANAKAPSTHQNASLKVYDLREEIIRTVNKIPGLSYTGYQRIERADGIRELLLTFRTTILIK